MRFSRLVCHCKKKKTNKILTDPKPGFKKKNLKKDTRREICFEQTTFLKIMFF